MLEKTNQLILLYDFYQELLTEKQRTYFTKYYEDNLTYAEIGELYSISRNAVHDQLQKAEQLLFSYEEKLSLVLKYQKRQELIQKYRETKDESVLAELEEV